MVTVLSIQIRKRLLHFFTIDLALVETTSCETRSSETINVKCSSNLTTKNIWIRGLLVNIIVIYACVYFKAVSGF